MTDADALSPPPAPIDWLVECCEVGCGWEGQESQTLGIEGLCPACGSDTEPVDRDGV